MSTGKPATELLPAAFMTLLQGDAEARGGKPRRDQSGAGPQSVELLGDLWPEFVAEQCSSGLRGRRASRDRDRLSESDLHAADLRDPEEEQLFSASDRARNQGRIRFNRQPRRTAFRSAQR